MRAAVLGSPVSHSLSPRLHTAGYAALGLTDWTYAAYDVTQDRLAGFVAELGPDWRGLSLTMPLKEVAFDVAATVSDTARAAGAVNTLVRRPDQAWHADNTDVLGIVRALQEHTPTDGFGHEATVLGSGATARSAILALQALGITDVHVAARRPQARDDLARWAQQLPGGGPTVTDGGLSSWADRPVRLVVSALAPEGGQAAAEALAGRGASTDPGTDWTGSVLLDVVYAGWPTPLARAASAARMTPVNGLAMLIHQAAAQFELFTGRAAALEAMRAAVA